MIDSVAGSITAAPMPSSTDSPMNSCTTDCDSDAISEPTANSVGADEEHLAPAEDVAEAAEADEQRGEHQRVAGDHPLQRRHVGVELADDRRDGDVQDRVVQHDDEQRARQDDEARSSASGRQRRCPPATASRWRWWCSSTVILTDWRRRVDGQREPTCAPQASTTGASSAGVAPCRITPSAPRSNWRCTAVDALRRRAGRRRRQPLVGDQRGDVLELLGGGRLSSSAPGKPATNGSARKRASTAGSQPLVRNQQVAVALQVGGQPADGLLQPHRFGQVVADRREARPDLHRRRVAARRARPRPSPCATQRASVSSVKNVCSTTCVERAARRARSEFGPNATSPSGMSSSNVGVEVQERELAGRPVVADDHLAVPQPAHQPDEVLELRGGDRRDAEGVEAAGRCRARGRA